MDEMDENRFDLWMLKSACSALMFCSVNAWLHRLATLLLDDRRNPFAEKALVNLKLARCTRGPGKLSRERPFLERGRTD
jgi:hypothetical protein